MKNAAALALASLLSVTFLSSCSTDRSMNSAGSMAAKDDDGVTVIIIRDEVDDDDQTQQIPRMYRFPSPETISRAQAEISTNSTLRAVVQGKSVQLQNVVGVQTAYNGGKIVYVK